MEPLTMGILASVIANGLTTFAIYFGRRGVSSAFDESKIKENLKRDKTLSSIIKEGITSITKSLSKTDLKTIKRIRLFITSPDVDAIVRQIFASHLVTDQSKKSLLEIQQEFEKCFSLYCNSYAEKPFFDASILFNLIVNACERALDVSIENGLLSAHDAKSAARTNIVIDELQAIKANMKVFIDSTKINIDKIEEYEKKLRKQIAARHADIVPPHFESRTRIPINNLYVTPTLECFKKGQERISNDSKCSLIDFLRSFYRAVILGNPGCGKSTMAAKICYDFANRYEDMLIPGRRVTPMLVILRELGKVKKEKSYSILQFINSLSNSTYQLNPPDGSIEYLLRNGRLLLIFDGLDELLDTSYRQQISEDIESFSTLYPTVPIIVTSRKVGYDQAPLDYKRFDTFHIVPFNDSQVEEYVNKWFAADGDLTQIQQKEKAEKFLKESISVPDLRSNPLMLALMCNIYRGENYIPRNRVDVYEKCAIMLFEKWDKSRGISVPLPFEVHISPAIMYLANWIYSDETLQGGVVENALIDKSTEYLLSRRYEDADEAKCAAKEFIEFCRGRAWVFTDTGTTKEGDRLYQFTHRTFLEYFTASHLVRTNPTPKKLSKVLLPKISSQEWDVVAQLSFQLQNKQTEGAGDELLNNLCNSAAYKQRGLKTKRNLYSFAARILQIMIPSPVVSRRVTSELLEFVISLSSIEFIKEDKYHSITSNLSEEIIRPIITTAQENRSAVFDELSTKLSLEIKHKDIFRAISSFQITILLNNFIFIMHPFEMYPGLIELLEEKKSLILKDKQKHIKYLCKNNIDTCIIAVYMKILSVSELIEWHGIKAIFKESIAVFSSMIFVSYLIGTISKTFSETLYENRGKATKLEEEHNKLSKILIRTKTPWLFSEHITDSFNRFLDHPFYSESNYPEIIPESSKFLFFVSAAIIFEINPNYNTFKKLFYPNIKILFKNFHKIVLARYDSEKVKNVTLEIEKITTDDQQKEFIYKWVKGEISLIGEVKDN